MDFSLLDEIMGEGWLYSISGIMGAGKRGQERKVLVVLLVPGSPRGPETKVVSSFRTALLWLNNTIVENHGHSTLARRLRKSGTA